MKKILIASALLLFCGKIKSQDTFSILAFDSLTREVGAAGASCLDMFNFPQFTNDFICELFPDTGAIASQASYLAQNQAAARMRMRVGDSPTQLLAWVTSNDVSGNPDIRQYGVVRMGSAYPQADAHTGVNCMNYKNHIIGPNYTIHGNILLGQQVLDSMEARFNREKGDLACKLMAAMQGAKMIGADTRCTANQSSSLFAFLKVAQPTDTFGKPSLLVSLKTHNNQMIEPIDSLQVLFDAVKDCKALTVGVKKNTSNNAIRVFPNPATDVVNVRFTDDEPRNVKVLDILGNKISEVQVNGRVTLELKNVNPGIYFIKVEDAERSYIRKLIVN